LQKINTLKFAAIFVCESSCFDTFAEDRVVKFAKPRDKSENDNQSTDIAQENHDTDVTLGPPLVTLDNEIKGLRSPRDKDTT